MSRTAACSSVEYDEIAISDILDNGSIEFIVSVLKNGNSFSCPLIPIFMSLLVLCDIRDGMQNFFNYNRKSSLKVNILMFKIDYM